MHHCDKCDRQFASKFSLFRHTSTVHAEKHHEDSETDSSETQLDSENFSSESDESNKTTNISLDDEVEIEDEEEDEQNTSDNVDEGKRKLHALVTDMVDCAYAIHRDEKEQLLEELSTENIDKNEAQERVHKILLPKYRKSLRNIFRNEVMRIHILRKHRIFKAIMEKVQDLELDGFDRAEAIDAAFSYRKYLINRMIPSEAESEDTTDDDE